MAEQEPIFDIDESQLPRLKEWLASRPAGPDGVVDVSESEIKAFLSGPKTAEQIQSEIAAKQQLINQAEKELPRTLLDSTKFVGKNIAQGATGIMGLLMSLGGEGTAAEGLDQLRRDYIGDPEPRNTTERYVGAGMKGVPFGPKGVLGGVLSEAGGDATEAIGAGRLPGELIGGFGPDAGKKVAQKLADPLWNVGQKFERSRLGLRAADYYKAGNISRGAIGEANPIVQHVDEITERGELPGIFSNAEDIKAWQRTGEKQYSDEAADIVAGMDRTIPEGVKVFPSFKNAESAVENAGSFEKPELRAFLEHVRGRIENEGPGTFLDMWKNKGAFKDAFKGTPYENAAKRLDAAIYRDFQETMNKGAEALAARNAPWATKASGPSQVREGQGLIDDGRLPSEYTMSRVPPPEIETLEPTMRKIANYKSLRPAVDRAAAIEENMTPMQRALNAIRTSGGVGALLGGHFLGHPIAGPIAGGIILGSTRPGKAILAKGFRGGSGISDIIAGMDTSGIAAGGLTNMVSEENATPIVDGSAESEQSKDPQSGFQFPSLVSEAKADEIQPTPSAADTPQKPVSIQPEATQKPQGVASPIGQAAALGMPGYVDPYPAGLPRTTPNIDTKTFFPEFLARTEYSPMAISMVEQMNEAIRGSDKNKVESLHEAMTEAYPGVFEPGFGANGKIRNVQGQERYMSRIRELNHQGKVSKTLLYKQMNAFNNPSDLSLIPLDLDNAGRKPQPQQTRQVDPGGTAKYSY